MLILIPQIRSLSYFPPVITWVNYLTGKGFRFVIIAHQIDKSSFIHPQRITFVEISGKPYPTGFLMKAQLKVRARLTLWKVLSRNSFSFVWVCVWDFRFLRQTLTFYAFKGELVYHFLELDPNNFKYCRQADHVIVPEENRSWLTYFMAKLSHRPWVLPNIPSLPPETPGIIPSNIQHLIDQHKIIIFYSGLIDFEKRCLHELISAVAQLDDRFHLVLMPGKKIGSVTMSEILSRISSIGAADKVHFIDCVSAPNHLAYFKIAAIGIGLYRPTSLNQVYAAPNRIYEFTALGVPVILPHFPQFTNLQYKYPFGIVTVDPESISDIKNKIEMFGDEVNLQLGKANSSLFFTENANYHDAADRILKKVLRIRI